MEKQTTIRVSEDFRNWLAEMGRKGDTYEDIIKSLIFNDTPENINELLKKASYSYKNLAKRFKLPTKLG